VARGLQLALSSKRIEGTRIETDLASEFVDQTLKTHADAKNGKLRGEE
jgi:hypothetical protein